MQLIPRKHKAWFSALMVFALYAATTAISLAQTYTVLASVPGPYYGDAVQPSSLAQGANGNL
jgi:hypothetical protein